MSYQVLARKWRPGKFSEVIGQQHVVRALQNALRLGRLHHAYLFAGTRGVGKTTLARIFAKCLNCDSGPAEEPCGECSACKAVEQGNFVDLIEVDAASRTGVDDMRELLESSQFVPTVGKFKIYLIDEVHMLSTSSFNALLKTLEEPPEHIKFFFATTHPDKLPLTILSRCLQFNLVRLVPDEISAYLISLLQNEKINFDEQAAWQIALCAEGSMRDALSLLDQAIAYGGGELKTAEVEEMLGLTARSHVTQLLKLVLRNDLPALIENIASMHLMAADFELLLTDIIALLQEVAVYQAVSKPHPSSRFKAEEISEIADEMTPEDVQLFYQIALSGKQYMSFLPDSKAGFEMIMLRMSAFKPLDAAERPNASARRRPSPPESKSGKSRSEKLARAPAGASNGGNVSRAGAVSAEPAAESKSVADSASPASVASDSSTAASGDETSSVGAASAEPAAESKSVADPASPASVASDSSTAASGDETSSAGAASAEPAAESKSVADSASPANVASDSSTAASGDETSSAGAASAEPAAESKRAADAVASAGTEFDSLAAVSDDDETPSVAAASEKPALDAEPLQKKLAELTDLARWEALIGQLNVGGAAKAVCRHCIVRADADGIKLVIDKRNEVLITSDASDEINRAFSEHFGEEITVCIEVSDMTDQTLQQMYDQKETEEYQQKEQQLKQHPSVKSLQESMGASIESLEVRSDNE